MSEFRDPPGPPAFQLWSQELAHRVGLAPWPHFTEPSPPPGCSELPPHIGHQVAKALPVVCGS